MSERPVREPEAAAVRASSRGGPAVRRILLGSRLRRLREAKGISAEKAGHVIRGSQSKISRLELGRIGFKERDVADLLTLYGVTDASEREALLADARQSSTPAWWQRYGDLIPGWLTTYLDLEETASLVRGYETSFVPDLLQTRGYAHAVAMLHGEGRERGDIERQVDMKMRRQRFLDEPGGPSLRFVLDMAALRRPLGSESVIRAQWRHLLQLNDLPNVDLQVLPWPAPRRVTGAFTILRFTSHALPDVVYLQHLTGALYLEKPDDVRAYLREMDDLRAAAESPERTLHIIHELSKA